MTKKIAVDSGFNNIIYRLWWMCLGWGSIAVVYALSHRLQRAGHILPPLFVDEWLTYNVHAVWAYSSFFVFIPFAYLTCHPAKLKWLARSMQLCAVIAGAVYMIYPTTMVFPEWDFSGSSGWMLSILVAIDSPQNCAPSLHVALSMLATIALCYRAPIRQKILLVVWFLCIVFSVIALKRHMFIDVIAGVVLALGVVLINPWMPWQRGYKYKQSMGNKTLSPPILAVKKRYP